MEQAIELADVLVGASEQVAKALACLRTGDELAPHLVEIHRLENEGDRIRRDAVASLFASGTDPMVVIRWRDIFESLEAAVDACETVAHVLEGIGLRRALAARAARVRGERRSAAAEIAVGTRGSPICARRAASADQRGPESAKPPVNAAEAASAWGSWAGPNEISSSPRTALVLTGAEPSGRTARAASAASPDACARSSGPSARPRCRSAARPDRGRCAWRTRPR